MKKVLAIVLAAVMVLSCSMTAFAEVIVNGYAKGTGEVSVESAQYVAATAPGDDLTVNGAVIGEDGNNSVSAAGGSQITVTGNVNEDNNSDSQMGIYYYAVIADNASTVKIYGDVNEDRAGDAIYVTGGSTVVVDKNVTERAEGNTIVATTGSTVVVGENVWQGGGGNAINAFDSTVKVGGNVASYMSDTPTEFDTNLDRAIYTNDQATVIVEGTVIGNIDSSEGSSGSMSNVYIGQLAENSNININFINNVHYLIGTVDDGVQLTDITFGGNVGDGTIEGVDKGNGAKTYKYTSTSGTSSGLTITLKASNGGKQLKDYGGALPEGVEKSYNNGVLTLTLNSAFKGGLQNLQLLLEDIVRKTTSGGGTSKASFTGATGNPVTNGTWTIGPNGMWHYAAGGSFRNTWGYIAKPNDVTSAAWYYFDQYGNMLTGWQKLLWNGAYKWYYFSQTKDSNEGKCLVDCITPDGYKVGPDGAWIE